MAIIEISDLTCCFGDRAAVDGLDVNIEAGSVVGLLGRNGAGKSTALRMLLGFLAPTRGSSRILGEDSLRLTPATRARIGFLAESHPVPGWMRPGDFAAWQAAGRTCWKPRIFTQVLAHFAIGDRDRASRLSRGQRAGLCLAAVLAADPEVLVLDDPALGLDPVSRLHLLEAIVHLARHDGRTVIFSSHHIADVERVADRILVLEQGRKLAWSTVDGFRAAVRRWRLGFAGQPPEQLDLPGLLQVRRDVQALELTLVHGPSAADLQRRFAADSCEELPLTLEESFIAYVGERRDVTRFLDAGDEP